MAMKKSGGLLSPSTNTTSPSSTASSPGSTATASPTPVLNSAAILQQYAGAGQGNVLKFYERLPFDQQQQLLAELHEVDLPSVLSFYFATQSNPRNNEITRERQDKLRCQFEPPEVLSWPDEDERSPLEKMEGEAADLNTRQRKECPNYDGAKVKEKRCTVTRLLEVCDRKQAQWRRIALVHIGQAKLAVVLVATASGSRVAFNKPKGMFPLGPVSGKSIFQLICEQIRKLISLAAESGFTQESGGRHVPLYILTAADNEQEIRDFFSSNSAFGLSNRDIAFFREEQFPCLDSQTNMILLQERHKILKAPTGSGSVMRRLNASGMLKDMEKRQITGFQVLGLDNALCKVLQPEFIGYCLSCAASVGIKCVSRADTADLSLPVLCTRLVLPPPAKRVHVPLHHRRKPKKVDRRADVPSSVDGGNAATISAMDVEEKKCLGCFPLRNRRGSEGKNEDRKNEENTNTTDVDHTESGEKLSQPDRRAICVVEVSALPQSCRTAKILSTKLPKFSSETIGENYYSLEFARSITEPKEGEVQSLLEAQYHISNKTCDITDPATGRPRLSAKNGVATVTVDILDCLPYADLVVAMEVDREECWAPLLDTTGSRGISNARGAIDTAHRKWLQKAGGKFKPENDFAITADDDPSLDYGSEASGSPCLMTPRDENHSKHYCEISPLVSYAGEHLEGFFDRSKTIEFPFAVEKK